MMVLVFHVVGNIKSAFSNFLSDLEKRVERMCVVELPSFIDYEHLLQVTPIEHH